MKSKKKHYFKGSEEAGGSGQTEYVEIHVESMTWNTGGYESNITHKFLF